MGKGNTILTTLVGIFLWSIKIFVYIFAGILGITIALLLPGLFVNKEDKENLLSKSKNTCENNEYISFL